MTNNKRKQQGRTPHSTRANLRKAIGLLMLVSEVSLSPPRIRFQGTRIVWGGGNTSTLETTAWEAGSLRAYEAAIPPHRTDSHALGFFEYKPANAPQSEKTSCSNPQGHLKQKMIPSFLGLLYTKN